MITILRIGHRVGRDSRISTHCGLVARAFGADGIIYTGDKDSKMMEGIEDVTEMWGGPFQVRYEKNWKKIVESFDGVKVHLTMYGMPVQEKISTIQATQRNILIIVGGEKVPPEIYHTVDYNIAVTSQPHSEIAALGVFLHEYTQGKELQKSFDNAQQHIIPQERGKKTVVKK